MTTPKDKFGRPVAIGSKVRLLDLSSTFLASLPKDEIDDVRSMIGEVFEVYEIDEYGCAWVMKEWHFSSEGQVMSHSLALDSAEMELLAD